MNFLELSEEFRRWMMAEWGLYGKSLAYMHFFLGWVLLAVVCFILWWLTRQVLIGIIRKVVIRTKFYWDHHLLRYKVYRRGAIIFIAAVVSRAIPVIFRDFPNWKFFAVPIARIYIVVAVMAALAALLNAISDILEANPKYADKPIRSYKQIAKIVVFVAGIVMILAIILGKPALYVLGGFGAITAVLLLIFRDPILGFVASIQMSAIDLVRVGDWITVEKYGADGEVSEINLTTIKVRNWDMTMTIVPTYALVSESFRNWRGMEESEGRRIKRHINIKISSIKFCDQQLFDKLITVQRIKDYLLTKKEEIQRYNVSHNINETVTLNGRQLTNIGIFRIYATTYLEQNPNINTDMIFMVRQLQANENGLPLEIYAFSKIKKLEEFEEVAADIFDHLLAAVPFFELEIFQAPSGSDMKKSFDESPKEDNH